MIISDYKKIIFIHNPKCAGTTVRNSLTQLDSRNNYYWMFDILNKQKIDKAHMPLHILKQYSLDDFKLLEDYFVFGFVRNPYTRVISAFNETHKKIYHDFINNDITLEVYQVELNKFCNTLTKKNTEGWTFKYTHFVRQEFMFMFGNKMMVDIIIKLEDIESGVKKLKVLYPEFSYIFEGWLRVNLNKKSINYSPKILLYEHTLSHITKIYERDFILFDYNTL
jgi:hypothetical protein